MGYDIEIRAEHWQKSKMKEIIVNDYHEGEWRSWCQRRRRKERRRIETENKKLILWLF